MGDVIATSGRESDPLGDERTMMYHVRSFILPLPGFLYLYLYLFLFF